MCSNNKIYEVYKSRSPILDRNCSKNKMEVDNVAFILHIQGELEEISNFLIQEPRKFNKYSLFIRLKYQSKDIPQYCIDNMSETFKSHIGKNKFKIKYTYVCDKIKALNKRGMSYDNHSLLKFNEDSHNSYLKIYCQYFEILQRCESPLSPDINSQKIDKSEELTFSFKRNQIREHKDMKRGNSLMNVSSILFQSAEGSTGCKSKIIQNSNSKKEVNSTCQSNISPEVFQIKVSSNSGVVSRTNIPKNIELNARKEEKKCGTKFGRSNYAIKKFGSCAVNTEQITIK